MLWAITVSRVLLDSFDHVTCANSPVVRRPSGRGPALLHPADLWAVLFGGGHSETREGQENEEIQEAAVLTISLLPVAPLSDQNLGDGANGGWAEENFHGALFVLVAGSDCMLIHTHIIYLLNLVNLHILGFLTLFFFFWQHNVFTVATLHFLEENIPMMNVFLNRYYFLFLPSQTEKDIYIYF